MSEYETDDDSSDVECPTCGRDDFASKNGMKIHHSHIHGESIAGVDVECVQCGDYFTVTQCREDNARFCSRDCVEWRSESIRGEKHPNWKGGEVEIECCQCGSVFSVDPNKKDSARFCSLDCNYDWLSEQVGEDNPNWNGGKEMYYDPGWDKQRQRALSRDE